ncbi:hypothetical protein AC578_9879 [Pseudocercospora eumusae]|uniref:DUF7928 domain-containing protein n=1 Tax=Pseudocercospora eumusae TaxID=321146 RepID=A0A139HB84_9PEZI|nr:hypothetical protein AC578_9879 [Pseudocercospora eumusae]
MVLVSARVCLSESPKDTLACPANLVESALADGCIALNVPCAMTVHSRVIKTFLAWSNAVDVPLKNGLRAQVIPTLEDLPRERKLQFAAFVAQDGLLVVWDDDFSDGDEEKFIGNEKKIPRVAAKIADEESGEITAKERPTHLMNTGLVSFTLFLITIMLGAGFRQTAIECMVDKSYLRLAFLALTPVQVFFTLFFAQVIVGCIAQVLGPIRQMEENSRFYSAMLLMRLAHRPLPHVTIQCPVYKEGLASVIAPTAKSIRAAISTCEMQDGSANIFVGDDGLQIINEQERQERIDLYADHCISSLFDQSMVPRDLSAKKTSKRPPT